MDPDEWDTRCGIGSHDIHRGSIRLCEMMGPDEWNIQCGIGLHDIQKASAS